MLEAIVNKTKWAVPLLVGSLVHASCIAPQTYSWKTESVVSTAYQKVDEASGTETRYKITSSISETGSLSLNVKKMDYEIGYDVLQPIETQKQRQYAYGRSKSAAAWADVGLGAAALGTVLMLTTETCECVEYAECGWDHDCIGSYCAREECSDGSSGAGIILGAGVATVGVAGAIYWGGQKKSRPTKRYQTVEVASDAREQKPTSDHVMEVIPAISTPLEITSSYFTLNGVGHTITTKTNIKGNSTIELLPSSPDFMFSLDNIAMIDAAQQLSEAGYEPEIYLPLLEQAATSVTYNVTVETKATDGKNAKITVPIQGYELSQNALEQVIMNL